MIWLLPVSLLPWLWPCPPPWLWPWPPPSWLWPWPPSDSWLWPWPLLSSPPWLWPWPPCCNITTLEELDVRFDLVYTVEHFQCCVSELKIIRLRIRLPDFANYDPDPTNLWANTSYTNLNYCFPFCGAGVGAGRNYLRPGAETRAEAEIILIINIFCSQFGGC